MYARRRFVFVQIVACLLATARIAHAQNPPPDSAKSLRIGLLPPATSTPEALSVERGVRLGADEAKQTARLFGKDVRLYEASAGGDAAASALRLLSERQVQLIIGASAADAATLSAFAEQHHLLFINAASRAQSLRAACRRYTFHVAASEAMYANAAATGASGSSLRAALTGGADGADSVALWVSTLERYGAAQINARYRNRFHAGMDGDAWAGWFAVKVASESALRAGSSEPGRLLVYLESSSTSFDGHKGWPLSFRIAEHQLRQPLYVITRSGRSAGAQTTRDVPELRDASTPTSGEPARLNHTLDRLVASPTAPRCQWRR